MVELGVGFWLAARPRLVAHWLADQLVARLADQLAWGSHCAMGRQVHVGKHQHHRESYRHRYQQSLVDQSAEQPLVDRSVELLAGWLVGRPLVDRSVELLAGWSAELLAGWLPQAVQLLVLRLQGEPLRRAE